MKKQKIKKLISFDFDDTLFHTPLPEEGKKIWKQKTGKDWPHRGWWSKPESLDTEIFDIPINLNIYEKYKRAVSDPSNYVILATGRIKPLEVEVFNILDTYNFNFDEIHLNPGIDTYEFKSNLFEKLINELQPEEFIMYDDRKEHLIRFVEWAKNMPCKVTLIDAISGKEFKNKEDKNLQEQIRKVLREEVNSDDSKTRQEEAADLIKQYGHFSSPDLRYITRPLYSYIEYENFGRLKELGVKYRFTPISEINLNGALSRFIKERGVFNGIGGNIIRLYNDEPVTKSDISRIRRKIQNIIDEFNSKLRTNYQIDGVVGDKSSDTLRNQLNQKLTDGEYSTEPTYNNIGIKISRGFEDEYIATIPMDEIDKPQMLD